MLVTALQGRKQMAGRSALAADLLGSFMPPPIRGTAAPPAPAPFASTVPVDE
jgi:hypothetical protein